MQITIRNQRLLRALGYQPSSKASNMIVGLSIRGWIDVIQFRLRQFYLKDRVNGS